MKQPKQPEKKNSTLRNVALLSGIAAEMGIIIYLGAKGGKWLDAHYENEKKIFTLIGTLLGLGLALWVVLRQIKKIKY
ncbi:MAG: AtpZ/AtpI family protein [Flavobacteriaceae bacterium]|nr:AtpZ/AtpI family protein [Flavobacteriaceae bacterium]